MRRAAVASIFVSIATIGSADLLPVTQDAVFTVNGQEHMITRTTQIDPARVSMLGRTPSDCPAPCIAPMFAAPDVATLGELDVIEFLSGDVAAGEGLLVDARMPDDRAVGFIAASVNIPAMTIDSANPYRGDILRALGAQEFEGIYNYDDALSLVIFDSGPASLTAVNMISDLLDAGYPADKIAYYRGGMQVWASLGLSTQEAAQ